MSEYRTGSGFRQRLGYYVTGLAIGFLMLAMLWWMKSIATTPRPQDPKSPVDHVVPGAPAK